MSDTNRVGLAAIEEGTYGTTPASPKFFEVPSSGQPDLGFTPQTTTSNLIRSDRQVSDLILVGGEAGGDVNSELAFGIHDRLLRGVAFSAWQARLKWTNYGGVTQISNVDGSDDEFDVSDLGAALVENDIVRAENFNVAENNGFHIVGSGSTNTAIVVTSDLEDETTPPTNAHLIHVGRRADEDDIVAVSSPSPGITSSNLDFGDLGLQPGDWVVLHGRDTDSGTWPAGNNGFCRVLLVGQNAIVFDRVPTGWTANNGDGTTVDIYLGERLVNGVTRTGYSLERTFADHSPVTYQYLTGYVPDQLVISASSQSVVEANLTFVGLQSPFKDDSRLSGASTLPAPPFSVFNASSNVARLTRGGTSVVGGATKNFVTEVSLTIANNLRRKNAVGFLGAAAVGAGEFNVTGSLASYFDDKSLAEEVVNNTETSMDVAFQDGLRHVFLIDVPRMKWSEGRPEVPGKNDDVVINPNFQAIASPFGYTTKFMRFYGYQS